MSSVLRERHEAMTGLFPYVDLHGERALEFISQSDIGAESVQVSGLSPYHNKTC